MTTATQFAPIWNSSGTNYTAIRANVTDVASSGGSMLMDLRLNNNSLFSVGKTGAVTQGPTQLNTLVSTNRGLIIQGAAAQSANLQEWRDVAGNTLAAVDRDGDIVAVTGAFHTVQITSTLPRQSGLLFLDNGTLNTSSNFIHDRSNPASPKLVFRSSGNATPDISLNVLTSASGSSSGVQTLSFEGSAGQLFSISDVLNSGTIFGVNDISGLPLLEVDATGLISLARFGTNIVAHTPISLGGTTSSFPSIRRNGSDVRFRLADNSADSNVLARGIFFNGGNAGIKQTANNFLIFDIGGNDRGYWGGDFGVPVGNEGYTWVNGGWYGTKHGFFGPSSHVVELRGGTNSQTFRIYNTFTDASNYIRQALLFATFSGTVHAQHSAEGLGTGAVNIPMVISPRGTGAFILGPMPDGATTGGNARGANAVDLQLSRSAATQVASGPGSFTAGGGCTASGSSCVAIGLFSAAIAGNSCFVFGDYATASGEYSFAFGRGTSSGWHSFGFGRGFLSNRSGQFSFANGSFSTGGDAQNTKFVARCTTTGTTPGNLLLGTSWGASATDRISINSGEVFGFIVNIIGSKSDGTAIAHYVRKGAIKRVSNTTTLAYIETIGTDYEDNAATDVAITADDANDALQISATGIAGETWRWVATIEATDLGFGT